MKYTVTSKVTFIWEVEADNENDAIETARDMGDMKAKTKFGGYKAKIIK